jgi:mRNA interferase RelE/StbE
LTNWKFEIKPTAEKQYLKLDRKTREKIKSSLKKLEQEENPLFHKDVKPLAGQLKGDYRLRIGNWRLLFTPDKEEKIIYIYAVLPRGDAY